MPKVLLLGWDGADWDRIHPLMDTGGMPNINRMVTHGVMGDMTPLTPLCSPLLWTSVATGLPADSHGILDTMEPDPVTGGVRPVSRASLAAPHIWDILAGEGLECQVTGWPATHPAEGRASCVSDGFAHGAARSLHPPGIVSTIAPLHFDPRDWTGDDLRLFVPELARIDQGKDKRLARLAVILAESVSAHAAATTLMDSGHWDFAAVWYGAVGQASLLLQTERCDPESDALYADALGGVYRFLDLLLGRLLTLAGPEATVLLVSDRKADAPQWHASAGRGPRGLLCAMGPAIKPDELAFGAGLLDIAPTILALFDFAPAPGMEGRAIFEVCASVPSLSLKVAARPAAAVAQHPDLDMDLAELAGFGYIDTIAAARQPEARAAATRRDFNLAQVLIARNRPSEAVPHLERLVAENPTRTDIRIHLAHAYRLTARYQECRALCETLLLEHPESPIAPLARAHIAIAEGDPAGARGHLAMAQDAYGIAAALDIAIGLACLHTEDWEQAAAAFRSAIHADPGVAAAHEGLARARHASGHHAEAAAAALDAIRLRYDLPDAHDILGSALRALGRDTAAGGAFAVSRMLRRRVA